MQTPFFSFLFLYIFLRFHFFLYSFPLLFFFAIVFLTLCWCFFFFTWYISIQMLVPSQKERMKKKTLWQFHRRYMWVQSVTVKSHSQYIFLYFDCSCFPVRIAVQTLPRSFMFFLCMCEVFSDVFLVFCNFFSNVFLMFIIIRENGNIVYLQIPHWSTH